MRVEDLNINELLEVDSEGGVIRFAGQRALLIDAVAMGLLRKYLVENFGVAAARTVLTQFGFAHGWRMAEAIKSQFEWESPDDWRRAGPRLHMLEGLFRVEVGSEDTLRGPGSTLVESYEAEQHLLHFGRAKAPACWTISGLISGYLSQAEGVETYVLEERCVARGDAACHLVARSREEWGEERSDDLQFFEPKRLARCLDVSLRRVIETLKATEDTLSERQRALVRIAPEVDDQSGMVAKSPAMRTLVDLARRVAKVDSTILITGESGSGKERIARLIHSESKRAGGPFIAVNCAAITESLLESELFGHARGAFTGASENRPGLFEAAHRGTLLLDEIGDISPAMQVKLLRVLQEREVRRVGENKDRPVDVRVLAATNRDLADRVAEERFRADLYYRINVVELHLPALRERRADILAIARTLLAEAALRMNRDISTFSPACADQLLRHHWPGNVRELENAMERAVALALGSRVELDDLPEEVRNATPTLGTIGETVRPLEDVARDYIVAALELNHGNQTHTAEQLGIGSATLYRKLKSYGLIGDRVARVKGPA